MAYHLFSARPSHEPMLTYCHWSTLKNKLHENLYQNTNISFKEIHLIMSSPKCRPFCGLFVLILSIHWDRVTIICVSKLTIIDSDNCLSPGRRQAIISTNVGILLVGSLYPPATKLEGGYIGFTLSVCLSVNLSCPPRSINSSGWILSMFGTNDHWHERVCRM